MNHPWSGRVNTRLTTLLTRSAGGRREDLGVTESLMNTQSDTPSSNIDGPAVPARRDPTRLHTRATYTVDEVAAVLGISRGSAYAAVNRGEIPSVRINRRLLVPRERLHQFLNSVAEPANA